jgi:tetratricopeptide (TPR) repeat protein
MAQSPAISATDTADAVSNAVITPDISLFIREILEKALTNPVGVAPRWAADAWALLANVLMNDYLNWWNDAGREELRQADDAVHNALALDPKLAFAHHAQGLIHRAQRTPKAQQAALECFTTARNSDGGFARAHAQLGNQMVLLGQEKDSHGHFQDARSLNSHHPACGYFDWGEGRAYFQEAASASAPDWAPAIELLKKSINTLPTVWYNRCYLAAAQDAAGQTDAAKDTMTKFINLFGKEVLKKAIASLQPRADDPESVAKARNAVLQFIQKF